VEKRNFEFNKANLKLTGQTITELNTMGLILEASRRVDEQAALEEESTEEEKALDVFDEESIELTSIGVPSISPSDSDKDD